MYSQTSSSNYFKITRKRKITNDKSIQEQTHVLFFPSSSSSTFHARNEYIFERFETGYEFHGLVDENGRFFALKRIESSAVATIAPWKARWEAVCKRAFVTGVSAGWRVNRHPMLVYDYWNKSVAGAFIEVHPAAFAYSRSIRWPPRLQLYRLYIPSVGGGGGAGGWLEGTAWKRSLGDSIHVRRGK